MSIKTFKTQSDTSVKKVRQKNRKPDILELQEKSMFLAKDMTKYEQILDFRAFLCVHSYIEI